MCCSQRKIFEKIKYGYSMIWNLLRRLKRESNQLEILKTAFNRRLSRLKQYQPFSWARFDYSSICAMPTSHSYLGCNANCLIESTN